MSCCCGNLSYRLTIAMSILVSFKSKNLQQPKGSALGKMLIFIDFIFARFIWEDT
jgi:hypothetical protein